MVKTVSFGHFTYVGDPANTVRIFNELEVDELILLDIGASINNTKPDLSLLADIAEECFYALAYGGGSLLYNKCKRYWKSVRKIIVNSSAVNNPSLINEITETHGSQSLIVSIDVKVDWFGKKECEPCQENRKPTLTQLRGHKKLKEWEQEKYFSPQLIERVHEGFDLDLVKSVSDSVNIPVVAHGGAGTGAHIKEVINVANASAVALEAWLYIRKKEWGACKLSES